MICSVCQVKHEDAGNFGNWIKEDGEEEYSGVLTKVFKCLTYCKERKE